MGEHQLDVPRSIVERDKCGQIHINTSDVRDTWQVSAEEKKE